MNDTLLYRRFAFVVAMIAAIGVGMAHVILETRGAGTGVSRQFPAAAQKSCAGERMCLVGRLQAPLA